MVGNGKVRPLIQSQVHVGVAHEIGITQLGLVDIIYLEIMSSIDLLSLRISPDGRTRMPHCELLTSMSLAYIKLAFRIDVCKSLLEVVRASLVSVPFLGGSNSILVLVLLDHTFRRHEVMILVSNTDLRLRLSCDAVDPTLYRSLIAEDLQFLMVRVYQVGARGVIARERLGQVLVVRARIVSLACDGGGHVVAGLFIGITTPVSVDHFLIELEGARLVALVNPAWHRLVTFFRQVHVWGILGSHGPLLSNSNAKVLLLMNSCVPWVLTELLVWLIVVGSFVTRAHIQNVLRPMVTVLVLHPRQIWMAAPWLRLEPRPIILLAELLDESVSGRHEITVQHFISLLRLLLYLGLLLNKVGLVVVLSLEGPRHLEFASVEAEVGASGELVRQSLVIHTLLDTIDDANDVVDILLEFLALLETVHRNQVGLLISEGIQVATSFLVRSTFDGWLLNIHRLLFLQLLFWKLFWIIISKLIFFIGLLGHLLNLFGRLFRLVWWTHHVLRPILDLDASCWIGVAWAHAFDGSEVANSITRRLSSSFFKSWVGSMRECLSLIELAGRHGRGHHALAILLSSSDKTSIYIAFTLVPLPRVGSNCGMHCI